MSNIHLEAEGSDPTVLYVSIWNFDGGGSASNCELCILLSNWTYVYQNSTNYNYLTFDEYEQSRYAGINAGYYRFATVYQGETYWTEWTRLGPNSKYVNGVKQL